MSILGLALSTELLSSSTFLLFCGTTADSSSLLSSEAGRSANKSKATEGITFVDGNGVLLEVASEAGNGRNNFYGFMSTGKSHICFVYYCSICIYDANSDN